MDPLYFVVVAVTAITQTVIAMHASAAMQGMNEVIRNAVGVTIIMVPTVIVSYVSAFVVGDMADTVAVLSSAMLVIGSISTALGKLLRYYSDKEEIEWLRRKS